MIQEKANLEYKQVINETEYREAYETYGNVFRVGMGAEAIEEVLRAIDLGKESAELKKNLKDSKGQKRARIIKELKL